jgi:hypothetical protein
MDDQVGHHGLLSDWQLAASIGDPSNGRAFKLVPCSGVLLTALGACLVNRSWLALAFSLALGVLFDLKSLREEQWLAQLHPEYLDYRNRTRKFVPWSTEPDGATGPPWKR